MSEVKKRIISQNEKRNSQMTVYSGNGETETRHEPIDPRKPMKSKNHGYLTKKRYV